MPHALTHLRVAVKELDLMVGINGGAIRALVEEVQEQHVNLIQHLGVSSASDINNFAYIYRTTNNISEIKKFMK